LASDRSDRHDRGGRTSLETRAAEIDDDARAQLGDDVLVRDGELAVVKALLLELIDWDSGLARLLNDELDTDTDAEDDE
jgi:hypothetical protein